jgi:hypothetical protein
VLWRNGIESLPVSALDGVGPRHIVCRGVAHGEPKEA